MHITRHAHAHAVAQFVQTQTISIMHTQYRKKIKQNDRALLRTIVGGSPHKFCRAYMRVDPILYILRLYTKVTRNKIYDVDEILLHSTLVYWCIDDFCLIFIRLAAF